MQYIDLFPTPLFVDLQKELAKQILPIAEEYIFEFGKPFRGNDNYISTYNIDGATLKQRNDIRINPLSEYLKTAAFKYFSDHCIDTSQWKFNPYYLFNKTISNKFLALPVLILLIWIKQKNSLTICLYI